MTVVVCKLTEKFTHIYNAPCGNTENATWSDTFINVAMHEIKLVQLQAFAFKYEIYAI